MNNNNLETLEKCFTNFDILFDLFKYFDLKEQIKLTGVCTLFGDIIINYIWKYKYGELKVISIPSNYIITNIISEYPNELELIQECSTLLSETEFEEFFNKNAGNIKKLFVTKNERQKRHIEIKLGNKFKNLLELTYKDVGVQSDNFEKLAQNCTKLERLCVQNCYNSEGCILTHIDVVTLEKMKSLKCLEIYFYYYFIESSYIDEILQKLKLQTLKINDDRYLSNTEANRECGVDRTESLSESYPCEELVLGRLSDVKIDTCITSLLSCMKNLQVFHFNSFALETGENVLSDIITQTLQEQCTKLKFLHIKHITITPFTPMHSLTHLIIEKCLSLTWKDMEIVLSVMKLTAFTSHDTEYSGAYKCFEVSETLKYLDYDGPTDTDDKMDRLFQTDNDNFKNLTTLKWVGLLSQRLGRNIATVCPNLQLLKVRADIEFINQISRLKSLKQLKLAYKNRLKEADLLTLLKHSSLNYLKMRSYGYEFDDDDYENDELLLADNYQTNLLFLDMDVGMFITFEDYWLGLVSRNSRLNIRLHCSIDGTWKYFLRELKNHPKFPKRLKSIKINGFNIDIKDLRENFDETYHWIKPISDQYEELTILI